jgi:hypothetical protein
MFFLLNRFLESIPKQKLEKELMLSYRLLEAHSHGKRGEAGTEPINIL